MSYAEFSGRPSYIRATGDDGKPNDDKQWKWSGAGELPKRGAKVTCPLGEAIVEKYFVESGWVGVLVRPLAPPAKWAATEGKLAHFFGAEIKEVIDEQG